MFISSFVVTDSEAIGVRRHDLDVEGGHAEVVGDELRVAGRTFSGT
jgi:hypothetical protein